MTIRRVFAGNPSEQTIYVQGDRKRMEFRNYEGQRKADGSHSEQQETVTDGWYIDLDSQDSCDRKLSRGKRAHGYVVAGKQPAEKPEFVDIGESETGFAVQLVMVSKSTYTLPDGTNKQTD